MFEPTNIAAEIIALTALANSTLGVGRERVQTSEFRHVTCSGNDEYPLNGVASTFGGPVVPEGKGFLLTHFSLYAAAEPPVNGTLSIFYGIGYNAITARVGYNLSGNSLQFKATAANAVQAIINRPVLFVFPAQCTPIVSLTPGADPRTALSIQLYANFHGYFIPAAYQVIFTQFETQLKAEGT